MLLSMKLKELPQDFDVEEIPHRAPRGSGPYAWVMVRKEGLSTPEAVERIAKKLHVPSKSIKYAGLKDKHAVTTQMMSVQISPEKLNHFLTSAKFVNPSISLLGCDQEPISNGTLLGNKFKIVVRKLHPECGKTLIERFLTCTTLVNYFDEQRFSQNNVAVGRALLKGDYTQVCTMLGLESSDPIKALQNYSQQLLKLRIHSYQSYIWNNAVSRYFEKVSPHAHQQTYSFGILRFPTETISNLTIPFPGFGFDLSHPHAHIILSLLEEEKITIRDFIIRKIPDLSVEGGIRSVFVLLDQKNEPVLEEDNLNHASYKAVFKFTLPKGSYATMLFKQLSF